MSSSGKISSEAVEHLLEYLPFFRKHAAEELYTFQPPEQQDDGSIVMGSYTYHPKVSAFFEDIYEHWMVSNYIGKISWEQLEDPDWMAAADIDDLRLSLTFLARSERWANGSWKDALEKDIFVQILERLETIYKQ